MNVVKRGTIAILSLGLMVSVAGYVNYKYNPEREKNLGQTIYVNGKDNFEYQSVSIYDEQEIKSEEKEENSNNLNENLKDESMTNEKDQDEDIAVFRYDRDNMFSELSETYSNIIKNENTSIEKISEYQEKLNKLVSQKNLINMVENVIKAKGIKDIVIIPTSNDNINVVIKSKEALKDEQIAQIQQIIVDQLGVKAEKISISCKED